MFNDNMKLQNDIVAFTKELIYHRKLRKLLTPDEINMIDRNEITDNFINDLLYEYERNEQDKNMINKITSENIIELSNYTKITIDKLIPKLYFIEINKIMCEKYGLNLVSRIFDTKGKDGFWYTKDLMYYYKHDFSDINQRIKNTMATETDILSVKKGCKKNGYILNNKKYLSTIYANQIINFFDGKIDEPKIFDFFLIIN